MKFIFLAAASLFLQFTALNAAEKMKTPDTEIATLAGGCFWCMFPPFAGKQGIIRVTAGYTGGKTKNPTYEEVSSGTTGHVEAVEIEFDRSKITYEKILEKFWKTMDPTDA